MGRPKYKTVEAQRLSGDGPEALRLEGARVSNFGWAVRWTEDGQLRNLNRDSAGIYHIQSWMPTFVSKAPATYAAWEANVLEPQLVALIRTSLTGAPEGALVLADWLEETGDCYRAKLLRRRFKAWHTARGVEEATHRSTLRRYVIRKFITESEANLGKGRPQIACARCRCHPRLLGRTICQLCRDNPDWRAKKKAAEFHQRVTGRMRYPPELLAQRPPGRVALQHPLPPPGELARILEEGE